jgi:hypothetical protein
MKLSSMISELTQLKAELGDVEVLISDGFRGYFYSGNYRIVRFDTENQVYADIGIGGCLDDDEHN